MQGRAASASSYRSGSPQIREIETPGTASVGWRQHLTRARFISGRSSILENHPLPGLASHQGLMDELKKAASLIEGFLSNPPVPGG